MGSTPFGDASQLGYAVRDLRPWVDAFVAAGVGPWWISRDMAPQRFEYRGEQSPARFDVAISWRGSLMIEIIRPVDSHPSPYRTFIDSGREGLQHVAFFPDDPDEWVERVTGAGYRMCLDGESGGFRFTYFEAPDPKLDTLELGRLSEDARLRFAAMREICAVWDGRDPFRQR
jgi:catechol 2,3-dioxygenase-like lactoylglutathione lyase family enzyme